MVDLRLSFSREREFRTHRTLSIRRRDCEAIRVDVQRCGLRVRNLKWSFAAGNTNRWDDTARIPSSSVCIWVPSITVYPTPRPPPVMDADALGDAHTHTLGEAVSPSSTGQRGSPAQRRQGRDGRRPSRTGRHERVNRLPVHTCCHVLRYAISPSCSGFPGLPARCSSS